METGGIGIGASIGGGAFTGGGAAVGAGTTSGVGAASAASAPAAQGPATISMDGQVTMSMDQLSELLEGFSTAEILLALMMSGRKKDESSCHGGGGGGAMAFLAGMAVGGLMRGGPSQQMLPQAVPPTGTAGGSLNVLA